MCGSVRHVGVPHSSPFGKFAPNLNAPFAHMPIAWARELC
jgi:hypothetical protein